MCPFTVSVADLPAMGIEVVLALQCMQFLSFKKKFGI